MNESPICFGATDNIASSFKVPFSGTLASVKLVHLDGYVRCNEGNSPRWSFWGCETVKIRNSSGSAILPSREFSIDQKKEESWRIPGYNSLSSELVLSADISSPLNVTQGQWLRLSYTEGLSSRSEDHKGEKSCCDVYARFT